MKECYLYKKLDKKTVHCQTCSHFCKIQEGKVGICGVRKNIDGKLYALNYSKAVAVNIDPIEKKPLFHFLPGSLSYSLATIGCNFRCANCQNFDISQMYGVKGRPEEYEKIYWGEDLMPEEIVQEAIKNKCPSISYTYTEPTIFLEYALDTMKIAKEKNIKNVWVSNGFMSDKTIDMITPYIDAINVDIKSFDDKFYQSNCGARVEPVLNNCRRFIKEKVWLEITTLVIPTLSDDEKMLRQIAKFIKNELGDFVPWHVSAFSGAISWKLQHLPDTPLPIIKKAYKIGKEEGLKYVYGGNVPGEELENTHCPKCQKIVVQRISYQIMHYDKKGKCPHCGHKLEGIYD